MTLTVYLANGEMLTFDRSNRDDCIDVLGYLRDGYSPGGMPGWIVSPVVEYSILPTV
jgi:hypothetical protein